MMTYSPLNPLGPKSDQHQLWTSVWRICMWILGLKSLLTNEKGTGAVYLFTRLMSGEWRMAAFSVPLANDY